jgi:hypothetical protein
MKVLFYWNDHCNMPSDVRVNRKTKKGVLNAFKRQFPNALILPLVSLKRNKEGDVRLLVASGNELEPLWGKAIVVKDGTGHWKNIEIKTARAIVQQRLNNLENIINFGDGKSLNIK